MPGKDSMKQQKKAAAPTKRSEPTPAASQKSLKRKTVDDQSTSKDTQQPPAKSLKSANQSKPKVSEFKTNTYSKGKDKETKTSAVPLASISRPPNAAPTKAKKPPKKVRSITPEAPSNEENGGEVKIADDGSDEEDAEDDYLGGFSTDEDSSDEEDLMDHEPAPIEISKLPTVAKDDLSVKRKLDKAKRQPTEDRGVLFLGRLPHGFYEEQMKAYFSQFGTVTRLRLSRNKKTGKPKHYGFIEFDSSSVAQIVAETMDNYLLSGHILQCKVVPKEKVHPELWVGANRKWRTVPNQRVERVKHNKPRTEEQRERTAQRLLKRQADKARKLKELGIDYDISAVGYKKSTPTVA